MMPGFWDSGAVAGKPFGTLARLGHSGASQMHRCVRVPRDSDREEGGCREIWWWGRHLVCIGSEPCFWSASSPQFLMLCVSAPMMRSPREGVGYETQMRTAIDLEAYDRSVCPAHQPLFLRHRADTEGRPTGQMERGFPFASSKIHVHVTYWLERGKIPCMGRAFRGWAGAQHERRRHAARLSHKQTGVSAKELGNNGTQTAGCLLRCVDSNFRSERKLQAVHNLCVC